VQFVGDSSEGGAEILPEAAARSNGRFPSMLPETSSMTMSRMGWGVLSNWMMGCSFPSSRSPNASRVSIVTSHGPADPQR
jgi:hypothetical protein